jgi:hypothetical protein
MINQPDKTPYPQVAFIFDNISVHHYWRNFIKKAL